MEARQSKINYSTTVLDNIQPKDKTVKDEKNNVKKENIMYLIFKRIFDIIGGVFGLIILLPLTIIVFIGNIMSKDNGPVFYVQKRIGMNGKLFKIYKFRTMVVGADKKLRKHLSEHPDDAAEYKTYKKLKEDPRITKFGMLLRKTSLDEFPQFINVIKGDMSLVGPRPYLLKEKKDMGDYYNYIIKCKPGLTCLWQVSGRNNLSFEDRLKLDIEYINNRNLLMDTKLALKTIIKVFKSEGAV